MKMWRIDLLIALGALLVSALMASAAIYQSKVFSDQLSATVWPYLSFNVTYEADRLKIAVANDGAGPAIIDGAQLTVDGKPMSSMLAALQRLSPHPRQHRHVSLRYSSLGPGQVIRPGASVDVIALGAPGIGALLRTSLPRVSLSVYYCSLLERCWVVQMNSRGRPREVRPESIPHLTVQ